MNKRNEERTAPRPGMLISLRGVLNPIFSPSCPDISPNFIQKKLSVKEIMKLNVEMNIKG